MASDVDSNEAALDGFAVPSAASQDSGRDRLEVLLSEFIERQRRGEDVRIEQFARRHRELKEEILELFPVVAVMEQWKRRKESEILHERVSADLQIRQIGRCRIVRQLGHGGMGIVYEAEHEMRGRVAVKLLPWRFADTLSFRRRFDEEIKTATKLRHRNIVSVLEYGEHDGFYYYVMPFVEGASLDWIIRRLQQDPRGLDAEEIARLHTTVGRLSEAAATGSEARSTGPRTAQADGSQPADWNDDPPITIHFGPAKDAAPEPFFGIRGQTSLEGDGRLTCESWKPFARIILQAAEALRYAHGQGTVHCDIKPGNLLLDTTGRVWVADFGLARTIDSVEAQGSQPVGPGGKPPDSGPSNFESVEVAGTRRYLAPERYAGRLDARCDVFSLGMTLFELVTLGRTDAAKPARCAPWALPMPRSLNPAIPRDLEAIVLKAAAPAAELRYQTAGELVADLLRFLNGEKVSAKRPGYWRRLHNWFRRRRRRQGPRG